MGSARPRATIRIGEGDSVVVLGPAKEPPVPGKATFKTGIGVVSLYPRHCVGTYGLGAPRT